MSDIASQTSANRMVVQRLLWPPTKEISMLRSDDSLWEESSNNRRIPSQRASIAEDVSVYWRHHALPFYLHSTMLWWFFLCTTILQLLFTSQYIASHTITAIKTVVPEFMNNVWIFKSRNKAVHSNTILQTHINVWGDSGSGSGVVNGGSVSECFFGRWVWHKSMKSIGHCTNVLWYVYTELILGLHPANERRRY